MAKRRHPILGLVLLLALVACTARPALAPTATARPTPRATATARPSATAQPSPSATATQPPTATPTVRRDCGPATMITDDTGRLQVQIPCGAAPAGAALTLQPASECILPSGWRPLGGAFRLAVEPGQPAGTGQSFQLTRPITLTFTYTDRAWTALLDRPYYLDASSFTVYYSPTGQSADRAALPTTVDRARHAVTARTLDLGYFQLAGRYNWPAGDRVNDIPVFHAAALWVNDSPIEDVFDIAEDQDWFTLLAVAGATYTIQTRDLAPGVDTVLAIRDEVGVPLVSDDNSGGGKASRIEWQPSHDAPYSIGVSRAPGSIYGCAARYALEVTAPPATLTLHNSGQIEYWAGADWVPYARPSMALTPGWHYFRINGQEAGFKVGSGAIELTIAIVCPQKTADVDEWRISPGNVEYFDNGWQQAAANPLDEGPVEAWVCAVAGLRKELTVRVTYEGATMEKTQDIIGDAVINFPAGQVHSSSGSCTHYYAGGEWRPFRNDMLLLPLVYTFRFNDGTPDSEYSVVAGRQVEIH